MKQYSDELRKNPSNDRIKVREMSNFQIKKNGNEYTQNLDRIMMERGSFFEQDSNRNTQVNDKGQVIFENNDNAKFGEITGNMFDSQEMDRGLPVRSQFTKKRQQYDQNEHLDFDLFNSKPSNLHVTNFDPTLIQGSAGSGFADITSSMTNMSTQLSPVTLCSTQIDRLNNNLFYFLYDIYDKPYMTNGLGLFSLFGSLYFSSSGITEIELKKVFDFPKREELYNGLIKIQNTINSIEHMINFKNFIIIGHDVPYDPRYHEAIKDFCTLVRVDTTKPFSEAKKLNEAIKKIFGTELKNVVTPENLEKLQLMLLTTCVVHPIWETPFDRVINGSFYTYGQESSIKYLHGIAKSYGYFEDNTHQVLEIKCANTSSNGGHELTMGFVLHKNEISNDIDDIKLHYFISHMKECLLDEVKIPMFNSDYKIRFNSTMQNLGLTSVFTKISCPKFFPENVVLQDVIQNIKIIVDDKFQQQKSGHKEPKGYVTERKFICNKPFIYYFRLVKTNTILLHGLFQ